MFSMAFCTGASSLSRSCVYLRKVGDTNNEQTELNNCQGYHYLFDRKITSDGSFFFFFLQNSGKIRFGFQRRVLRIWVTEIAAISGHICLVTLISSFVGRLKPCLGVQKPRLVAH